MIQKNCCCWGLVSLTINKHDGFICSILQYTEMESRERKTIILAYHRTKVERTF